jgi:hypothetical protein
MTKMGLSKSLCEKHPPQGPAPRRSLSAPDCPYQRTDLPNGRIFNLAECFLDGSIRLARDVPFGSPTWKRRYHRGRNAVEARNATFQHWEFKRLPVFGLPATPLFLADVLMWWPKGLDSF